MVCDGPDPPDNSPHELTPPPRHDLMMNGNQAEESDDENEYFGYEPLPQGPEAVHSDDESDDDSQPNVESQQAPSNDVPLIESMDNVLTREVMSAMANFALPQASIPDWAQSITEEQWKQTLNDRIERLRSNR
ncbi:hypothetical protein MSG28_006245 [Choristoneura fumiferana]|uniref:Uncharacterized protein n=1 Tax=Choristoneura fumiferana TaxID=7141 RepID=A0ACC0JEB9_CHOFU|nr:hypothetical protein MSG28_006245 [Choristoneura fumiferana]